MTPARTLSRDALVLDLRAYAEQRAAARERMIPVRRERRLRLGDQLVVEFENAATLTYQVQEMLFAEGVTDDAEVAHELDAYSRLLPTSHELAATLFVELDDVTEVRAELERLTGVQHQLRIEVRPPGGDVLVAAGAELPGPDEDGPSERTFSVHFVRFTFSDAARDAFRDPDVPASLVVEHPSYADDTPIDGAARRSLLADLALDG